MPPPPPPPLLSWPSSRLRRSIIQKKRNQPHTPTEQKTGRGLGLSGKSTNPSNVKSNQDKAAAAAAVAAMQRRVMQCNAMQCNVMSLVFAPRHFSSLSSRLGSRRQGESRSRSRRSAARGAHALQFMLSSVMAAAAARSSLHAQRRRGRGPWPLALLPVVCVRRPTAPATSAPISPVGVGLSAPCAGPARAEGLPPAAPPCSRAQSAGPWLAG